jgi:cob(I)alamin adenosyltransferase
MQGMIHVYTGDGKGKTTAAFGLAVRAVGHGKRVLFVQFLKGGSDESGEIQVANKLLPGMEILRFPQVHPRFDPTVKIETLAVQVQRDFEEVKRLIGAGSFDIVILDEVDNCVSEKLLPVESLLELLDNKPGTLELVLTGRGAHPRVIEKADYVTELKMVKHPAETSGTPAREGIEY